MELWKAKPPHILLCGYKGSRKGPSPLLPWPASSQVFVWTHGGSVWHVALCFPASLSLFLSSTAALFSKHWAFHDFLTSSVLSRCLHTPVARLLFQRIKFFFEKSVFMNFFPRKWPNLILVLSEPEQ